MHINVSQTLHYSLLREVLSRKAWETRGYGNSSPADDVAQSGNSYLAQDNSGIVSAQGENRDKVREYVSVFNKYMFAFIYLFGMVIFVHVLGI